MKRVVALLLALIMLFSLIGCGKKAPATDIVEDDAAQKVKETIVDKTEDDVEEKAPVAAETDRETLEKIADMVGIDEKEDVSSMDDDTLEDYIYSELDKEVADLIPSQDAAPGDNPAVDSTGKEEYYEEDGSMNQPFDVIYPELVANGEVEYATDALLLKISNSQGAAVTSGMQSAGVAKLESVVPMGEYTWYKASLVKGTDISAAVTELRSLSEIEMVDYDYVVETTAMDEYKELPSQFNASQTDRWDLHYCGVPDAYKGLKAPGGSASVIVAVIDTGVDYTHEDLKKNIWVNSAETPDNGIDDDRNGYVDDYYGVNVVTGSGSGNDDHGHGTHVAGIIAAQNNNLGIAGLAYNCKIMPIKAGNHSGYFLQSDIAAAVLYAYENGAEVINMSFGGTACSQAVQDALMTAYSRCVLVASAGNDSAPNEGLFAIPNYPAALTYVVGVMAVDRAGHLAAFSNWDSVPYNNVEYETFAPGVDIVSTIPGNGYAAWSGTSMAAPYVSAVAAILRSEYTDRDKYPTRFIYGQICSTSEDTVADHEHMIVNLHDAMTKLPKPILSVPEYFYFDTVGMSQDTAGKNTGDGIADSGETLAFGLTLRNHWGMSENTIVTIDTLNSAGIADPYITILNDTVNYGSVGTYSTQDCGRVYSDGIFAAWENPFYIKIADTCPNDYTVTINVRVTAENGMDAADNAVYTFEDTVSFSVRNGVVLPSIIAEDMTLTSDNLYIISNGVLINEGVTVTAMPGTRIQFWSSSPNDPYANTGIAKLKVAGTFITQGTEENPVYIYPSELFSMFIVDIEPSGNGYVGLDGADITNLYRDWGSTIVAKNSIFRTNMDTTQGTHGLIYRMEVNANGVVEKKYWVGIDTALFSADTCVFYKYPSLNINGNQHFKNCAFIDCAVSVNTGETSVEDCLFLGNYCVFPNKILNDSKVFVALDSGFTVSDSVTIHCADTEKTYIALKFPLSSLNAPYYANMASVADETMSALGIPRAQFESEEEWNAVTSAVSEISSMYYFDIGARFDIYTQKYLWADGTDVGEWLGLERIPANAFHLYSKNFGFGEGIVSNDSTDNYISSYGYYCLYEVPADYEGTLTSAETVVEALTEELKHVNSFYNNAVLNRIFTETDTSLWMRATGSNYDTITTVATGSITPLGDNYWGTTNEALIDLQILDGQDYVDYGVVNYKPYLTTPPELVFPYVTDVEVQNSKGEAVSSVGNETITVTVSFSRDMNTEQPIEVTFGSASPYRDYVIAGDFVDERTWEGTYTISSRIGNGYQYFSIGGGEADNGKDLYTDWARFGFEIDTTAAQAMIMQGSATEEGITLTWMQDDFDTLMGYNVYRSTALDGQYQRLNSSIIPVGNETFFDDTVEPGTQYFYNFTVVQTDLTESTPSGKITIWSKDTMAPNVYHSVVANATTGSNLMISATVTDNMQVSAVKLLYRTTGTDEYKALTMDKLNDKYSAIIPAEDITTAGLQYYIDAFDGVSHTYRGTAEKPYSITVRKPASTSDFGDVDGNGVINLLDALMVLKAKNHKLNLDAAQFARADLDGNKTLEAWEALRILQYASGTVGSVLP